MKSVLISMACAVLLATTCVTQANASTSTSHHHGIPPKQEIQTGLTKAIIEGDNLTVLEYLKKGANPNGHDEDGFTPLITAAAVNNVSAAIALIEHGADPTLAVVDEEGNMNRPLIYAAVAGAREVMILLIYHNAPVHPENPDEAIPIIWAAQQGHTSAVEILWALGADINTMDSRKRTPLGFATWEGHTETVKMLLDHGANKNLKDERGNTALDLAIRNNQGETARLLMQ